jgi:IS30 family transposase
MKIRNKFRHLTESDRDRIHALYMHGHSQRDIAGVLDVDPGTISRELNRYGKRTWRYNAVKAQIDAEEKRARSKRPGMKVEDHPELKRYIIKELMHPRSPDEIAGRLKRLKVTPRVGKNAIYKWLYSEDGKPYCRYLCTRRSKVKRHRGLSKKVIIPDRIPLHRRPKTKGLIHTERDLFVSPRSSNSKASGLLIVVPEAKLFVGSIIPDRTTVVVTGKTKEHFDHMKIDTCTVDNGFENVRHKETGIPTYFCDKGSPWQKPHVEGGIGLIRRWFLPKGTDLGTVSDETFQAQLHVLNGKYRKSLGYQSAYERAIERGIIERVPKVRLPDTIAFR